MASRLMHLAAGRLLEADFGIRDVNRFRLGLLLPDSPAGPHEEVHSRSHFCVRRPDGRETMDFAAFRRQFARQIPEDELYLGYYLHLIQDCVYRVAFYAAHPEPIDVPTLHRDYRLLNGILLRRFSLIQPISLPWNLPDEPLFRVAPFAPAAFLEELRGDFAPVSGTPVYLTPGTVDDFLTEAVAACGTELAALRRGGTALSPASYSWN